MKFGAVAAAVVAYCVALPSFAQSHPPAEAFGNLPAINGPALSPDGKYLAALQSFNGVPVVAIYQVGAPPNTRPALVASPDGIIAEILWAKSDRLVVIEKANMRARHDWALRTWWRALAVDPQGRNAVLLFNGDPVLNRNTATAAISDIDLDDPDHIFMPVFRSGYELDRVNVRDGSAITFVGSGMYSAGWIMDGHGHVIVDYDGYPHEHAIHVKVPKGDDWRELASFATGTDTGNGAEGVTEDGKSLVMNMTTDQKRDGLFAIDLQSAKPSFLFADPNFDVNGVLQDDWTGRVIGVSYIDDKPEFLYFDPEREHLQKTLEAGFPGCSVKIASHDLARNLYVIEVDGPRNPTAYYYLDPKTMHTTLIATAYPALTPDVLGEMKPISYTARDGLVIHGYLTLPPGSSGKDLPLVVMPHGGPLARDALGFDWWSQFLANRGYAVFQPNFRGSAGYGQDFAMAGHGQWGLKMQDDITDGVQALIANGTANAKRVCIVGASYGGYAALAGAAFTPDLYACAISYAGVSDLDLMLSRELRHAEDTDLALILEARIGDPDRDGDRIAATSPSKSADKIKIPVLLMHASNDTTVPIEQSTVMNAALLKAHKNVQFIQIDGDDHYLDFASTRIQVLNETAKFLEANIGAGAPPPH